MSSGWAKLKKKKNPQTFNGPFARRAGRAPSGNEMSKKTAPSLRRDISQRQQPLEARRYSVLKTRGSDASLLMYLMRVLSCLS